MSFIFRTFALVLANRITHTDSIARAKTAHVVALARLERMTSDI